MLETKPVKWGTPLTNQLNKIIHDVYAPKPTDIKKPKAIDVMVEAYGPHGKVIVSQSTLRKADELGLSLRV